MNKTKRLGQHFLISNTIAHRIVCAANITKNDIVLELGTGLGILIPNLCKNAKKVISVDVDETLHDKATKKFHFDNLELVCDNGFNTTQNFSIFVSNLPYSQSKAAVEWLSQKSISHAVLMVQKDFSQKLLSSKHTAVSVIANYCFFIEKIIDVGPNNFSPRPNIDSVVIRLVQKSCLSSDVIKTINLLFSYRRKTICNIIKNFDNGAVSTYTNSSLRLDDLTGDEIINIAKQINNR